MAMAKPDLFEKTTIEEIIWLHVKRSINEQAYSKVLDF